MSKKERIYYRYSNCFKEQIIQEVSNGRSPSVLRRIYGIRGSNTIRRWILQYGRKDLLSTVIRVKMRSEEDRLKELEAENKRLKLALADAVLSRDVLECLIAEVDRHYDTDVKKNFGTTSSVVVRKKRVKQ